jgi:predicted ribosome quality control (RQC) complex YloA/Tae2 family protein
VNLATVTAIRAELEAELVGRRFGKVFQLAKTDLAIDFRLNDSKYLFVSTQPGNPRTYLIRRRLRDLEKASDNPGNFAQVLRKRLAGAEVTSVGQAPDERVILIGLRSEDEAGDPTDFTLAIQLTGSSANVYLLDSSATILESLKRSPSGRQQIGETYAVPERRDVSAPSSYDHALPSHANLSEMLDAEDLTRAEADRFRSLAASARGKVTREIAKRRKLIERLGDDLVNHGDADRWKRFGDLLLANVSTARREGGQVVVTDYFDAEVPEIKIDVDENDTLTDAAEKYFKRYTKARNAGREIEQRLQQLKKELVTLDAELARLEEVIAEEDEDRLREFVGAAAPPKSKDRRKAPEKLPGVRTFVSSDGVEILVGKKAKDNDFLTFRVAKSLDTWMHAADYAGSHVVIRNPSRKEIPPRTLVEAAQLAAFYSQGKSQPKAAVHYTQKKFVNKPKGAAAGLVSLASFKTLLVEPKIGDAKLKTE